VKLDLGAISEKWLQPCGACDGGLAMSCSHPDEDYRPVISDLVAEARRLVAQRQAVIALCDAAVERQGPAARLIATVFVAEILEALGGKWRDPAG
jgi:hypothetical protein